MVVKHSSRRPPENQNHETRGNEGQDSDSMYVWLVFWKIHYVYQYFPTEIRIIAIQLLSKDPGGSL